MVVALTTWLLRSRCVHCCRSGACWLGGQPRTLTFVFIKRGPGTFITRKRNTIFIASVYVCLPSHRKIYDCIVSRLLPSALCRRAPTPLSCLSRCVFHLNVRLRLSNVSSQNIRLHRLSAAAVCSSLRSVDASQLLVSQFPPSPCPSTSVFRLTAKCTIASSDCYCRLRSAQVRLQICMKLDPSQKEGKTSLA
jgi:hypothetical protein